MKTRNILLIALAVFPLLLTARANAATVIHLICRGGHAGNTEMTIESLLDGSGVVYYTFDHFKGKNSDVKRDGSHLAAGQCSWATAVLQSTYQQLAYNVPATQTQIYHYTSIRPAPSQDGSIDLRPDSEWFPDGNDPNEIFMPIIRGSSASLDDVAGTILDDSMIFNFYVTIDQYNRLVLQYIK